MKENEIKSILAKKDKIKSILGKRIESVQFKERDSLKLWEKNKIMYIIGEEKDLCKLSEKEYN